MERIKKKTLLAALPLLAAALLTVTACSHDTEPNPTDNGRVALSVTSGIATRAYDKTWEPGDAIGIYLLGSGTTTITDGAANRKYTTASIGENGAFAPATAEQTIYFPVSETDRFDLVAYYPRTATLASGNTYNVDVTTQTSQKAIDLMGAAKVTGKNKNDANVAFVFAHKLVKLDITLKGDGTSITDADLTNTVVKITNQQTTGTYDVLASGDVAVASGTAADADIILLTTELKAEGIVLPNTDTKDMELTFTVPNLGNATFTWSIKEATQSPKFEAGKKYKYTITIGKSGLSVTSTVTDWMSGNNGGETGEAE